MKTKNDFFNPFAHIKELVIQIQRENLGEIPKNILNTMDILFKNKEHKPLPIKSKEDGKIGIRQYSNGWHFVFTMNPGCDYEFINKNKSMFQSCVEGIIEIERRDKYLHINVDTFKFKKYKFNTTYIEERRNNYSKMWCPIIVGVKSGGKLLVVDIQDIPHILVAGVPKSGKSSWIIQLLYGISILRPDAIIFYIDFKGADAWKIEPIGFSTIEPEQAFRFLTAIEKEANSRQEFVRKNRISKIHNLKDIPPIIVAIDEITDMDDSRCQDIFQRLGRKGRNVGINLIAGTQKPSHKTFKNFCESRSLFEGRLCFRVAEAKDSRTVINSDKAYSIVPPKTSGRAIWQWGEDKVIQSLYISDKDVENLIESNYVQNRNINGLQIVQSNYNLNQLTKGVRLLDEGKQNIWLL